MKTIPLSAIHATASQRPPGYVDDVLSHAISNDGRAITISDEIWALLIAKYRTPALAPGNPGRSISGGVGRVIRRAAHAARSVAKTTLGIDRATDEQVEARLNVCRRCPGGYAIYKDGEVHTCGPMLESMKRNGEGTCGCVLRRKARDLAEDCPFGWWPSADAVGKTESTM